MKKKKEITQAIKLQTDPPPLSILRRVESCHVITQIRHLKCNMRSFSGAEDLKVSQSYNPIIYIVSLYICNENDEIKYV